MGDINDDDAYEPENIPTAEDVIPELKYSGMRKLAAKNLAGQDFATKLQKRLDQANVIADTATFGLDKKISGVAGGIKSLLTGNSYLEGFDKGEVGNEVREMQARDRLGIFDEMGAELIGSVSKFTGPGALAHQASKLFSPVARNSGKLPSFRAGVKELFGQGVVGATELSAEELVDSYEIGDSLTDAGKSIMWPAIQGFGGGVAGQVLLGRGFTLASKYGLQPLADHGVFSFGKAMAKEDVGREFMDTGVGDHTTKMGPEAIRTQTDINAATGESIFTTGTNGSTPGEVTDRLADLIAASEFPENMTEKGVSMGPWNEKYMKAVATINGMIDEKNARVAENFDDILGPPLDSASTAGTKLSAAKQKFSKWYSGLSSTEKGASGANWFKYSDASTQLGNDMAKDLGAFDKATGTKPDISNLDINAQPVYDDMINSLRPSGKYKHTQGLHRMPHGEKVNETNLDLEEISVADLYNTRKLIANKYGAGARINSVKVNTSTSAAAAVAIKHMDNLIAQKVGGNSDVMRKEFAQVMRVNEAKEAGAKFFNTRGSDEGIDGSHMQEFMSSRTGPWGLNDEAAAFRDGYKGAMRTAFGEQTPIAVMRDLLGDVKGEFDPKDVMSIKSQNLDHLRLALGKEEADKFVKEFFSDRETLRAMEKAKLYLGHKKKSGKPLSSEVREGDDAILLAAFGPGGPAVTSTSAVNAMGRQYDRLGITAADEVLAMINAAGPDAKKQYDQMIDIMETPDLFPAGGTAGVFAVEGDDNKAAKDAVRKEKVDSGPLDIFK